MKIFLKEHVLLVGMQCIQWACIGLLLLFSGFTNIPILLYGLLLSVFFLLSYLLYHYYRRRNFYKKLSTKPTNMEQLLEKTDAVPIAHALDETLSAQYGLFVEKIYEAERNQSNHLTFIDRWVHQMKTPLSVIELTAHQLDEPESSNIREETERMKQGLETVLYMARLRTIEQDFHVQQVTLEKLLQEVQTENKRLYIRNGIFPQLHIEDPSIVVETDEKWLFFIVDQLIQNAVKYSAAKSNHIDVRVTITNDQAVLSVQDYGVGIPVHDQKRIFQPFFTGDNGRKFRESTGMGLYVAREVATYMGHDIQVDSTPGEGTTFSMIFTKEQTFTNLTTM